MKFKLGVGTILQSEVTVTRKVKFIRFPNVLVKNKLTSRWEKDILGSWHIDTVIIVIITRKITTTLEKNNFS
jgi:hypothetical protein